MKKPDLAGAYEASIPQRRSRRLESLARSFRQKPNMERLIELRTTDPKMFRDLMTPTRRLELAVYEQTKQALKDWEQEDSGG